MAQFLLLCLIFADAFIVLAMGNEKAQTMVKPNVASFSNPPAPSPSSRELEIAEAPVIRKLGKHQLEVVKSFGAPVFSLSEAPPTKENMYSTKEVSSSDQTLIIEPNNEENGIVEGQEIRLKKQHHSVDKSVAGGGVILGGLATTFLVAVFCYIRATGRRNAEPTA